MAKKKTKPQLKTKQEIFVREWILLCLEQLGYSSILKKNEKVNSALELINTNTLTAKKKVNEQKQ